MIYILAELFTQPMNLPTTAISLLWGIPICLSISLVYKAIKIEKFTWPFYLREVALLFATLLGFLIVAAIVLLVVGNLVR